MLQFIPNNYPWILDLTHLKVTFNDSNSIFTKESSTEFSFPFSMPADEFYQKTDLHRNSTNKVTQFEGKRYLDGIITDATLKINTKKGNVIEGIIFSSSDNIPGAELKLEELDLDVYDVLDLENHAEETILLDYPDVTHNFPMVHTDKYNDNDDFNGFEQILNQHQGGSFVQNILEEETNIDVIKNFLQPFPYLMYLLKKGFEASGKTLQGDILTDNDINRALVFRDGDYYVLNSLEKIPMIIKNSEHIGVQYSKSGKEHVKFLKEYTIEKKGDYVLLGQIVNLFYSAVFGVNTDLDVIITKISGATNTVIYFYHVNGNGDVVQFFYTQTSQVDVEVSLDVGDIIRIEKIEPRRDQLPESVTPEYPDAVYLNLIPIRYRNPDESPIISLLYLNKIDLKRVVPDMTFGELVEIIRIWKNFDLVPDGDNIIMNYIRFQDRTNVLKLDETEVEEPIETFHDERAYELFFTDGKSEKYTYDSLYIDRTGVKTNIYKKAKTATEISIDGLPYPVISRNGVTTAHAFDDETSKLRLIFFKAAGVGESPACYNNENMLIPAVHTQNYLNWIQFLLYSVAYEWEFLISVEKWKDISVKSIIYAYNNHHLFSEIEKERISEMYWKIKAKTETLS